VPGSLDGESTQPVDVPANNPFASDEPTETAVLDAPGVPRVVGAGAQNHMADLSERSTQPMRPVPEPATAEEPPSLPAPPSTEADAAAGAAGRPAAPIDPLSETTLDTEPVAPSSEPPAKADGASDAKADAKPEADAKAVAKPDVKAEAKPAGDGTSPPASPDDAGAPTEIATADTGRVTASGKNRDS
jgi:hypothetical protein